MLSPAIYDRPEDLLRNASIAMHRAKDQGRNRVCVVPNEGEAVLLPFRRKPK